MGLVDDVDRAHCALAAAGSIYPDVIRKDQFGVSVAAFYPGHVKEETVIGMTLDGQLFVRSHIDAGSLRCRIPGSQTLCRDFLSRCWS